MATTNQNEEEEKEDSLKMLRNGLPECCDFSISIETRGKLNKLKSIIREHRETQISYALDEFLHKLNLDLSKELGTPMKEPPIPYIYPSKGPLSR